MSQVLDNAHLTGLGEKEKRIGVVGHTVSISRRCMVSGSLSSGTDGLRRTGSARYIEHGTFEFPTSVPNDASWWPPIDGLFREERAKIR